MIRLPTTHYPPIGWGMTSLVLGTIGLLLFFLPVLGMPVSALGMFFGLVGLVAAWFGGQTSLRWAVLGIGLCLIAMAINIALAYAPAGYQPGGRAVPQMWQSVPDRPWVAPPARPGFWSSPRPGKSLPSLPSTAKQLGHSSQPE